VRQGAVVQHGTRTGVNTLSRYVESATIGATVPSRLCGGGRE